MKRMLEDRIENLNRQLVRARSRIQAQKLVNHRALDALLEEEDRIIGELYKAYNVLWPDTD